MKKLTYVLLTLGVMLMPHVQAQGAVYGEDLWPEPICHGRWGK